MSAQGGRRAAASLHLKHLDIDRRFPPPAYHHLNPTDSDNPTSGAPISNPPHHLNPAHPTPWPVLTHPNARYPHTANQTTLPQRPITAQRPGARASRLW